MRSEQWKQTHRGVYMIPGAGWGPLPRLSGGAPGGWSPRGGHGPDGAHAHGVLDAQPGRLTLAVAVDIAGVGPDSVLSDRVHRRLIAEGLHPDPTPATIVVGGRVLHPDITFAAAKVCIECDSLAHHSDQRSLDLDHLKDHAYAEAGWRVLRVGWRRYGLDWTGFVVVVRHALDEWPKVIAVLEG